MKTKVCWCLVIGFLATTGIRAETNDSNATVYRGFNVFVEVMDLVRAYYLEQTDLDVLTEGAIEGMILAVDRFGYYESALGSETAPYQAGVGIQCTIVKGQLAIANVIPQSPAAKAELQRGDLILSIGEKYPQILTLRKVDELLNPKLGETVALQAYREGENKVREVSLQSELLPKQATWEGKTVATVSLITIHSLNDKTTRDAILTFLNQPKQTPLAGYILDLRGCSLGDEAQGLLIADLFIQDEQMMAEVVAKDEQLLEIVKAHDGVAFTDGALIVLVDNWTSGGAETLAAALHATRSAIIIGQPTMGRGIRQQRTMLEGGGAIVMTTGFYRFNEAKLWNVGLKPETTDTDSLIGQYQGQELSGITDPLILYAYHKISEDPGKP